MVGVTDRFIRTDDAIRLAVRDYGGAGLDLVLVHGFFGNLAEADTLGPMLTDHYRVIAYDQRGHGWSESGDTSVAAYVDDLRAVVNGLGLDRPVLCAGSFGTLVALAALKKGMPSRGFVNIDGHIADWPAEGPGPAPHPDGERILDPSEVDAYLEFWATSGPVGTATGVRCMQTLPDRRVELRPSQTELNAKGLAFSALPILDCYRALDVPVLLLDAAHEVVADRAARDAAIERLRDVCDCEVRLFTTGHWITAEDPAGVAAVLAEFAASL